MLGVVALDEDQVSGGERAAGQLELRTREASGRVSLFAGELVELGDVGPAVSEDDGVLAGLRALPPVLAGWAPNLIFGAGALYLLLTVRT